MALIQSTKDNQHLTFDDVKHRYTLQGEHVPGATTFVHGGYVTSEALVSWMKGQTAEAIFNTLTKTGEDGYYPQSSFWPIDEARRKEIIKEAKTADRKKSAEAAAIGTFVHDFAFYTELNNALLANGVLAKAKLSPDWEKINNGIEKFLEWKAQNNDIVVASEQIVASPLLQAGGKFDRLATRNGMLVLSDFKTSNYFYTDQEIQLAAYRMMIREWMGLDVKAIEILRFGKEGGEFETKLIKDPKVLADLEAQAIRCRETYAFRNKYESKYPKSKVKKK